MNNLERNRKSRLKKKRDLQNGWKAQVRANWGNKCAKCGRSECKLDTHHLHYGKLKWTEPIVGVLLCSSCHKFGLGSAHKGGLVFYDWFFKEHPLKAKKILELIKEIQGEIK